LGLLVEEQRTNLFLQSEDFSTTWANGNSTDQTNTIVSPAGTLTGDKLVEDTNNAVHFIAQGPAIAANTNHTFSCYMKAGERTKAVMRFAKNGSPFTSNNVTFDLSAGTATQGASGFATTNTPTITAVGNGWYRCTMGGVLDASSTDGAFQIRLVDASNNTTYTGDGYSGLYIWGAQLEAAAFPTSYIPTVAATVTRNSDAASMTGANFSSWYNQAEGTVYCDHQLYTASASNRAAYDINDNSTNNRIVYRAATTGVTDQVVIRNAGTTYAQLASVGPYTTSATKNSTGYKVNDFALVRNAATPVTDTSGLVPAGCTQLLIGSAQGNIEYLSGYIRKLAFYPSRLPDAQLQALTTV
jgi:hypothetical protein